MRKSLLAGSMILALVALPATSLAAPVDTMTVKATAQGGGSKSKPKPVSPSYTVDLVGANGQRGTSPSEHVYSWAGVTENGKYFPTCTAEQMANAQSDGVCKKGSLVAKGSLTALIGPEGVKSSNAQCSKTFNIYNSGAGKMTLFPDTNAATCAGVGYLPPVSITWSKKGTTSTQHLVFPENIVHPLPGVEGAFTHTEVHFLPRTTKVKIGGKKVKLGYLTSWGCGKAKTRAFTFTQKTPENPAGDTQTVSAGAC